MSYDTLRLRSGNGFQYNEMTCHIFPLDFCHYYSGMNQFDFQKKCGCSELYKSYDQEHTICLIFVSILDGVTQSVV